MNQKICLNKAFSLIELLVVIGIIGVLSSVIMANINSGRIKAKDAAFKLELKSKIADVINSCENHVLSDADVPAEGAHSAGNILSQNCGPAAKVTFTVEFTPTNGSDCTKGTIKQDSVQFEGC